jgi:hypothetical protein
MLAGGRKARISGRAIFEGCSPAYPGHRAFGGSPDPSFTQRPAEILVATEPLGGAMVTSRPYYEGGDEGKEQH